MTKVLKKWHLLWLQQQAENHALHEYSAKIVRRCFDQLRSYLRQKKLSKYARAQHSVVVAVKVMESLKSYQQERRIKKDLSIKAYQHLSKKLLYKSLRAFCVHLSRQALIADFQAQHQQRLLQKCLTGWDRLLQLKLTRANAFANCYALLMRRRLYTWREALQDQSAMENCQMYRR